LFPIFSPRFLPAIIFVVRLFRFKGLRPVNRLTLFGYSFPCSYQFFRLEISACVSHFVRTLNAIQLPLFSDIFSSHIVHLLQPFSFISMRLSPSQSCILIASHLTYGSVGFFIFLSPSYFFSPSLFFPFPFDPSSHLVTGLPCLLSGYLSLIVQPVSNSAPLVEVGRCALSRVCQSPPSASSAPHYSS
jgi:hypothetical protein